jgi:hypothetical protein
MAALMPLQTCSCLLQDMVAEFESISLKMGEPDADIDALSNKMDRLQVGGHTWLRKVCLLRKYVLVCVTSAQAGMPEEARRHCQSVGCAGCVAVKAQAWQGLGVCFADGQTPVCTCTTAAASCRPSWTPSTGGRLTAPWREPWMPCAAHLGMHW